MNKQLPWVLFLGVLGCEAQDGTDVASTAAPLAVSSDPSLWRSTTGPVPPKAVVERDAKKKASAGVSAMAAAAGDVLIAGVPTYLWRHGCGPTAAGMVAGYYDMHGYSIIDGDASTQTAQVDQAIASGGDEANPLPPGSAQHFEDYGLPRDDGPSDPIMMDAYLTAHRTPHANNCIADYMETSRSTLGLKYGWSSDDRVEPAFVAWVAAKAPSVTVQHSMYVAGASGSLTWELVKQEIDHNRPMIFLVDTVGAGDTDHFVTVIGYRESPTRQYASWDTWFTPVRWEDFVPMAVGQPWGIAAAHTFTLSGGQPQCTTNSQCSDGIACTVDTCTGGICRHDSSACGCTSNAQCDDGQFCNGQETCVANRCVSGTSWGPACQQATLVQRYMGSGNFNTTGEKWFYVTEPINGWWSSNMDGRTIRVNGQVVTPNALPLPAPIGGKWYFQFTPGVYPWASWGFW